MLQIRRQKKLFGGDYILYSKCCLAVKVIDEYTQKEMSLAIDTGRFKSL